MASLLLLAQLLLLGTVMGQAQTQIKGCHGLWNATEGNFSVAVRPGNYWANTTYLVAIKDGRNHSDSKSTAQFLLQALSPQNDSVGQWQGVATGTCGSVDTAILNVTENATHWISPDRNLPSVQIRVYISFPDNTSEFRTVLLHREADTTTLPSTTPNSVCAAQSSSFFIAALQLPLLLLTSKLLS